MKIRVLYLQPNTKSFAGIERVVDELCSQLATTYEDTFEIDVFYPSRHHHDVTTNRPYNKIEIETVGLLGLMRVFRGLVASRNYDIVVIPQIEPTVICWVACIGLRRNFVAHLHGNPRRERSHWKAKLLFFLMDKWVLRQLPAIFGTSPKQLAAFKTMFQSNVATFWVPNPVREFQIEAVPQAPADVVTFVNVGRFAYQKGQDILLAEFAKVHRKRPNARLKIVGYGDGEADLRRAIDTAKLTDVVTIEHHPENPQAAFATSDVYVSSSRWEGWSLAICEALRFGLPVAATDCEFGPSDILIDPRLGRLAPFDNGALAETMVYYCDHLRAERQHASYRQNYVNQFSVDEVVHTHAEALLIASGRQNDHLASPKSGVNAKVIDPHAR